MSYILLVFIVFNLFCSSAVYSNSGTQATDRYYGNPIVPHIGLTDSHIRCYNNRLYNFATQDYTPHTSRFIMKKWWVWSTADLVNWTFESELSPSVLGFPKGFENCWATDSHFNNGKYYWYVCNPQNTYVVTSDSPSGPWTAPIGNKPLMEGRDPSVFKDDDGKVYLVTDVWNFKIAELGDDMISLKTVPAILKISNPRGPYNPDGLNVRQPTDDKPFLHKHNNLYYLSWGCYYAVSDNIFGPYSYKGCFIVPERTDSVFMQEDYGLTHDRHGSFFEWNNQTYFICNDLSSNGAKKHWRNSVISYVHYTDDGSIEPLHLTVTGVARYDAQNGKIEAENYYDISSGRKCEIGDGMYAVELSADDGELLFTNVSGLSNKNALSLRLNRTLVSGEASVQLWSFKDGKKERMFAECELPDVKNKYFELKMVLSEPLNDTENLLLVFKSDRPGNVSLDYFRFL